MYQVNIKETLYSQRLIREQGLLIRVLFYDAWMFTAWFVEIGPMPVNLSMDKQLHDKRLHIDVKFVGRIMDYLVPL
jgi:hypothetical protein